MTTRVDVAVVGGGMVGLLLAAALRDSGLDIAVVEAASPASPVGDVVPVTDGECRFDPRVSALTLASRRMLERVGAWAPLPAGRICAYTDMEVWDADGLGRIHFDAGEVLQPELGYIVENSVLVNALRHALEGAADISFYCPDKVQTLDHGNGERDAAVLGLNSGARIEAGLVVGADGANSAVRRLAGLRTREWDYGQSAIATTVRTALRHERTAWQRFMTDGPLAFLPLQSPEQDQHYCSIVWSTAPEQAARLVGLDDAGFCRELGAALEFRLGEVLFADRRFSFPLRQRHAVSYWSGRVALAGDAAHTIHPLAGQGVNLGLLDAAVLAEEILHGAKRGYAPGDPWVLRRYQRRRMGHNLAMMGAMEGFRRLFGATAPPLRWLRNAGLNWADRLALPKQQIIRQATGLGGDLPGLAAPASSDNPVAVA